MCGEMQAHQRGAAQGGRQDKKKTEGFRKRKTSLSECNDTAQKLSTILLNESGLLVMPYIRILSERLGELKETF